MKINKKGNHLIADDGKILVRTADGLRVGSEVWLGYNNRLNGEEVEPYLETSEDYTEDDMTKEEKLEFERNNM